ncbi:MarR family winged helix-turn-helix transcriptional regulator [Microbispora triticiradicis]|uniref:MarR family transcriptional regulator n=2 Tax=Microbispora TaxID=2005 RepID=A0ABY3M3L3_9ACTN|nr:MULTISPECIES: MarR family transcriptional regulator [Microbispora]TLP56273.1 MarR family transcriptional regulator [Microbispora fusca]TYB65643.1 MarR family transcriptional regulator [Microbispora tritici]
MNSPRWLDADEQRAWRAYLRMQGRLTARLNRELQAGSALSLADYEVLVHLTDNADGRLRPFELERGLQWEQSRLSHHLTRMQRRGLVRREECEEDGRGAFVVISEEGRRAIAAAAPGHVATVRRLFFDGLTPEQVAALERLATDVLARLDDDSPGDDPGPGPGPGDGLS